MVLFRRAPRRRGAGSIIGSAFLLLILLTGFTFYTIHFKESREYTTTLQRMQQLDMKRSAEELIFVELSTNASDMLNVTLRNGGTYQSHIIFLVMYNDSSVTPEYYEMDVYLEPGETETDLPGDVVYVHDGEEWEIQFLTELGNVFSYSYPEDGQGTSEDGEDNAVVMITGIGRPYNATSWNLVGGTLNISGSISELDVDDSSYAVFRSYASGNATNLEDYVDNDFSNVDGCADKGTHGGFSAQQAGPDSVVDVLMEADSPNMTLIDAESFEGTWLPSGWSEGPAWSRWARENNRAYNGSFSADFDGANGDPTGNLLSLTMDCSDAQAIYVDFWYMDERCESNEFLLEYYDGSNWDPIMDLGATSQEFQWLHYQQKITDNQYFVSNFQIRWVANGPDNSEHVYVDYVTVKKSCVNYELDLEVQWTGVEYNHNTEELAIYASNIIPGNSYSLDGTGGYMIVGDGTPDWGSARGTISFWVKWDTVADRPWGQNDNMEMRMSGSNLALDWGGTNAITSSTSFVANQWYFIALTWNENTDELTLYVGDDGSAPTVDTYLNTWTWQVSTIGVTENNFLASRQGMDPLDGHGDELRYWDVDRSLADLQSDYDSELTGSEANLRSYFKLNNNFDDIGPDDDDGSGSGSYSFSSDVPFGVAETLNVDVWSGGGWQNVISGLGNGWNNVSVASYLDSSTFTIRFKGGTETGDDTQDSWDIDTSLLHLYSASDQYSAEVEFTGPSNTESWSEVLWQADSSWSIGEVSVTVGLYDYQLGAYPTSGSGYESYISDTAPGTDELKNELITVNTTCFRDASGNWSMRIEGVKYTGSSFDISVDWITFKPTSPTTGNTVDYDTWQEYCLRVRTSDGDPIPYAYASIYADGSSIALRDALTLVPVTNPGWVYMDANGEFFLELRSSSGSQETFKLNVVVGSVIGDKLINQLAP
jgi:hypothetical protein